MRLTTTNQKLILRAALTAALGLLGACASTGDRAPGAGGCRVVRADVVALEQAYTLNRFGAFVPAGMLYALKHDIVALDPKKPLGPGNAKLREDKRPRPLVLRVNEGDCLEVAFENYLSPTWGEEGGLVPADGGKLPAHAEARAGTTTSRELVRATKVSVDAPRTRYASFHVTGLELAPIAPSQCPADAACGGDGSNVGMGSKAVFHPSTSSATRASFTHGSLAAPGQKVVMRWRAPKEGTFFAYSTAAPVGGEGDGGQIGLGLFGAVNVEPANSRWYRSQVTNGVLQQVTRAAGAGRHVYASIDYGVEHTVNGRRQPVLAMLDRDNRIVHSDVNAIVVIPEGEGKGRDAPACKDRAGHMFGEPCGQSFREFTVILHDEIHAQQAFAELEDPDNPLHYVKDGMGINYGAAGMGSAAMSTSLQRGVGVAKDCPECRAEEFFLTSWANGDPALVLNWDQDGKQPIGARYPDDPSNVHHSYLGDAVRFRNLHAGPKETHVFHLHAHQWVLDANDPNSTYLDSQTISPGATFSYGIEFGGSGNRNYTPGDSIFHCHLYPHFAQGMWELWRVHDVFEDGNAEGLFNPRAGGTAAGNPRWRRLPDAEVPAGIESPAVLPIPGQALAPLPTATFAGYPFYIPGVAGHRPPQPPLDMDVADAAYDPSAPGATPDDANVVNGGLPRHVVTSGSIQSMRNTTGAAREGVREHALSMGGEAAQVIAQRVAKQDPVALEAFAAKWDKVQLEFVPHEGTDSEQAAMAFHEGSLISDGLLPGQLTADPYPGWWSEAKGYKTDRAATIAGLQTPREDDAIFRVNGRPRAPGAPYANPCPKDVPTRHYRAAFIQTELTYNKHGWFDPQARMVILENDIKDIIDPATRTRLPEPLFFRANSGECIDFKSSNFVPSFLAADDFQVLTPTDTIGQHIHLVKFDVTSSDGSGNGWNYEDSTFSPDEIRERIFAHNRSVGPGGVKLTPKPHPLFAPGGDIARAAAANPERYGKLLALGQCPSQQAGESDAAYEHRLNEKHRLCGAQRSTQRWWADPILNQQGKDNTLRTVFTHDHMGPSSHQQHGLYAGLVIEPANSVWTRVDAELTSNDLAQAGALQAGDGSLSCDAPNPPALCRQLIGGSNLAGATAAALLAPSHVDGVTEPREPLKLRGDGGPTATMANIIAPECAQDSDSNPLQPTRGRNRASESACTLRAEQTRREFTIAIADFGIAYNTALEPINPEPRGEANGGLRDKSAIRFGRRHVALATARPLGISSEDPGSQFVNYRHEPLALRLSEVTPKDPSDTQRDPLAALGGFEYRQSKARAFSAESCKPGDQDCLGDAANAFSTAVHAGRDEALAKSSLKAHPSAPTRELLRALGQEARLDGVLEQVEQWRVDFNCMLYAEALLPKRGRGGRCRDTIVRLEPWRMFGDPATPILPAYEGDPVQIRLIQGAQEAQHIFTMHGVKWHRLPASKGSGYTNAQPLGISEHFEFDIDVNPLNMPYTDYLYYGSSVDQLWDGMWGVLRSYAHPEVARAAMSTQLYTSPMKPEAFGNGRLADAGRGGLAVIAPTPKVPQVGGDAGVCQRADGSDAPRVFFDVSALRACQVQGDCDSRTAKGIVYNERYGLRDPDALVYVLNDAQRCDSQEACDALAQNAERRRNDTVLTEIVERHARKPIEPLVLRAAAGECVQVHLRNHLPPVLPDGPAAAAADAQIPERSAYFNGLPMITDGFNVNQLRMSSSVGMSVGRLARNPLYADGSNVGINGAVLHQASMASASGQNFRVQFDKILGLQGSLVPPCRPEDGDAGQPSGNPRCHGRYLWSTLDTTRPGREPVEFGALPIMSFGDPIKHPMHGLMGALVIGPERSAVCADNRFKGTALSAEICTRDAEGNELRRYVEHVLMFQDAVAALHGDLPVHDLAGAEEPDDYGMKAINYRTEPLWARRGNDPSVGFGERNESDYAAALSSAAIDTPAGLRCAAGIAPVMALKNPCDPLTPVLQTYAGETVRLHFVHAGGHTRQQGLAVSGHGWNPFPWSRDSRRLDPSEGSSLHQGVFNGFGPAMGVSLEFTAGGSSHMAADYLIRSQASFLFDGGLWGLLRVEQRP